MSYGTYIKENSVCYYCALGYSDLEHDKRKCLSCFNYDEFVGIECNIITEDEEYDDEL